MTFNMFKRVINVQTDNYQFFSFLNNGLQFYLCSLPKILGLLFWLPANREFFNNFNSTFHALNTFIYDWNISISQNQNFKVFPFSQFRIRHYLNTLQIRLEI